MSLSDFVHRFIRLIGCMCLGSSVSWDNPSLSPASHRNASQSACAFWKEAEKFGWHVCCSQFHYVSSPSLSPLFRSRFLFLAHSLPILCTPTHPPTSHSIPLLQALLTAALMHFVSGLLLSFSSENKDNIPPCGGLTCLTVSARWRHRLKRRREGRVGAWVGSPRGQCPFRILLTPMLIGQALLPFWWWLSKILWLATSNTVGLIAESQSVHRPWHIYSSVFEGYF